MVPLRPLTLGDVAEGVVRTVRGNLQATIGAALLVTVASLVVLTPLSLLVATNEPDWTAGMTDPSAATTTFSVGEQIPSLASWVTPVVLSAFLAWVVSRAVLGRRVDLAQTWAATRGRLPAVLGSVVVTGLVVLLLGVVVVGGPLAVALAAGAGGLAVLPALAGTVLYLLAALVLWTRWAFAAPAIVLERLGPVAGLRRSWRLTGGREFWRVLGIRLLTALVVGLAGQVLVLPLAAVSVALLTGTGLGGTALTVADVTLNALSVLVVGAVTTPFSAGVDAMLYVDQRIRREALDVTLIAATGSVTGVPGT